MKEIVLASSSPRREQLLKHLKLDFVIHPSSYEENMGLALSPGDLVMHLSHKKAEDVAKHYPSAIIIGADTIVVHNQKVIGKPRDTKHAEEILKSLSGQTHSVLTGVTLIDTEKNNIISEYVETKVTFRTLSDEEVIAYIATGETMDKAGGYGIQGAAGAFVENIEGDMSNVIGLPVKRLKELLEKMQD